VPTTPTPTPTAVATSCAINPDAAEPDNNAGTASLFNMGSRSSGSRTFHTVTDTDWMRFTAVADRLHSFNALKTGTDAAVALSIYASDGTTLITTSTDEVSFTPSVAGDYYLMARSTTGITLPCNANYTVALAVTNPDATPVPTPVGTPVPTGHERPPVSGAILSPLSGAVLTQTVPLTIEVALLADAGLAEAVLYLNDTPLATHPAAPANLDAFWSVGWTPASGVYSVTVALTDTNGVTATSETAVWYVDTAVPTLTLINEDITPATLRSDGTYPLRGTANDDSRVRLVEVQIDGGAWQEAALSGTDWLFALAPLAQANPNGGTLSVNVRVTDMAGRTASRSGNFTLDVVAPAAFPLTTSLTSGELITATQLTTGLNSRLSWPAVPEATAIYVGWTSSPTPTLGALTSYGAGAGTQDSLQTEGAVRYAHAIAVDANGNQTVVTRGPFYFDTAQTPDVISDLALTDWVDSGGKQIGQISGTSFGTQRLWAGWNSE
jgi:hypothetical protein